MHETLVKCIDNGKKLRLKARGLKQELLKENLNLEKTSAQQKENEETLHQLSDNIENVDCDIYIYIYIYDVRHLRK